MFNVSYMFDIHGIDMNWSSLQIVCFINSITTMYHSISRLECKVRFPVYHNVFMEKVEALYPNPETFFQKPIHQGKLFNKDESSCIATDQSLTTLKLDSLDKCNSKDSEIIKRRTFAYKGNLFVHTSGLCLAASVHHSVKLDTCVRDEPAQLWDYDMAKDKLIKNRKHSKCLTNIIHPTLGPEYPMLQPCNANYGGQLWVFKT